MSANYSGSAFNYSCTFPLPSDGTNNTAANPRMASLTHLSTFSPCIGAGSSAYASGVHIDGAPWTNPPCMGADQLTPGQATGALSMSIEAAYTNVAPGFVVGFVAQNPGPILTRLWDLDDGTLVTNQAVVSHAWNEPGSCTVRLTGYNDSFPEGVTATVQVEVPGNVYYVNQANPTPMFPYTSWATAATNIQEAINAASTVGRLVLATHGVYASGGAATQGNNRIALTDAVRVQSVNGPVVTVIQGATGIRCACVGTYAVLSGFTLTKGNETRGGGVRLGTLYNCTLINNRASDSGGGGGEQHAP